MNTLGSHPGAILFRFGVLVILILIMIMVFLSYAEDTQKEFERTSVLQTKKIIDSALAVVFATYAVNGKLNDLNELNGGNPFVFLKEYQMLPVSYQGEIDQDLSADLAPGWYYLKHRQRAVYKSRYIDRDSYFAVVLNYQDLNQSGSFEADSDKFQNLQFIKTAEI